MSQKKLVGRNVAIALGIACIILVAGIGGVMAYYTMQINNKDSTYNDYALAHSHTDAGFNALNSTYQDYSGTHSHTDSEYNDYVSNHTHANSEFNSSQSDYINYVATHHHTDSEFDSLQSTYNDYVTNHHHTDSEYNSLQSTYSNYVSTHSHTDSDFNSLQSTYNNYIANHHHTDSEYDSLVTQIANLQNQVNSLTAPKLIPVNLLSDDNRPLFQTPYLRVHGEVCNVGTNIAYNCKLHVVAYQSGGVTAIDTYITLSNINGESWTSVDSNIYYSGGSLTSWTITPTWTS